jgi:tRNA (cytidine/uridine-2'-O-)-methyltransferase
MRTSIGNRQESTRQETRLEETRGSTGSRPCIEELAEAMIEIILYCPEIPQNTGSIGRICAFADCRLHLIHPLGFEISDKNLRRAGMDYWKSLDLVEHADWASFICSENRPQNIYLLTTHADKPIWDASFKAGDGLLFGNEGKGIPQEVHDWANDRRLLIPKRKPGLRSLNLAVSVGIASYEAIRQISASD